MNPGLTTIAEKCLGLLLRPPVEADIIKKEIYSPTPLLEDIRKCSSPDHQLLVEDIFNILVKYFYAYIHPDSITHKVPLKEITACFNRFIHRRAGSRLLWGQEALRKRLLKYGFALAMLADLPKSAHIFWEIASTKVDPHNYEHKFMGVDIGAGTGILMLAQWISARKNRFSHIEIIGIERDFNTFERTALIAGKLNVGKMAQGEAKSRETYSFLNNQPVTYISNETLPGASARLWKEDFIKINKTLFDNYPHLLKKTFFFPNLVIAADKSGMHTVTLSKANCFHKVQGPPVHLLYPRAIELDSKPCLLTNIGNNMKYCLEDPWPDILSRRW